MRFSKVWAPSVCERRRSPPVYFVLDSVDYRAGGRLVDCQWTPLSTWMGYIYIFIVTRRLDRFLQDAEARCGQISPRDSTGMGRMSEGVAQVKSKARISSVN